MKWLLLLPLLIPLATAAVSLLAWRWRLAQRSLGFLGAAALLSAALALLYGVWNEGPHAAQIGHWPAPYGITLVADLLSALMVVMAGLVGLAVTVFSLSVMDREREAFGYYPLLQILLMGVCGAFLTGDIFNLYVWFEVMLIASFVLLALGGERAQMAGALKYVTINLISSAIFLAAVGLLYSLTGTLNMADLAVKLRAVDQPGLVTTLAMLFTITFGIKAAVFPLFFWLPAAYHTPPAAVSALFAGLLTKVGVYALIRSFTLLFTQDPTYTHSGLLYLAGLTMAAGVFGAIVQTDLRRALSFLIISAIGFMIMGLGLFTPLALAGALFYMIHDIIVKTNLFLISGVTFRLTGTYALANLGGLYRREPGVAWCFLIPALALAGVPPLSGFFAKLALVQAGLSAQHYWIVAVALAASFLTLYAVTRIWSEIFWKPRPSDEPIDSRPSRGSLGLELVPVGVLAIITVALGIAAAPLWEFVARTAEQLLDPSAYIQAVLGGSR